MLAIPIVKPLVKPLAKPVVVSGILTYVKGGLVLDLTRAFNEDSTTINDRSPESNNATLYSGRYASTNGVAGKLFYSTPDLSGIDLTGAGAVSQITFKGRAATGTVFTFNLASGVTVTSTQVGNNVWEDHTIAVANVTVNNFYAYTSGASADWSNVKVKAATASPRYQLNESRDASLDGYPAIDSSGSGYHGTHSSGVAGGATAEGINADVVGAAFAANEDKMYFDGVDDYVGLTTPITLSGNFSVSFKALISRSTGFGTNSSAVFGDATTSKFGITAASQAVFTDDTSTNSTLILTESLEIDTVYSLELVRDSGNIELFKDGVSISNSVAASGDFTLARVGSGRTRFFNGIISDVSIDASVSYQGYGNTNADWLDQIGSNNGTVNGSPVTVGQKRETILQTAGMDWNKYRTLESGTSTGYTVDSELWPEGNLTLTKISPTGFYAIPIPAGTSGDVVTILGSVTLGTTSPSLTLRNATGGASVVSNTEVLSLDGSFEVTLTATGAFSYLTIGDTDNGTVQFSDLRIIYEGNNYLIPESDSTAGEDALGNAIAIPRPTSDTWNLFGDAEYGLVADADSLDVTTQATWELWFDNTGVVSGATDTIIGKWNNTSSDWSFICYLASSTPLRPLFIIRNPDGSSYTVRTSGNLSTGFRCIQFVYNGSTLVCYVDGASQSLQVIGGTLQSSIRLSAEPVTIGTVGDLADTTARQISRPKIYSRALTAAEVLQNYNAQKSKFGL